MTISTDAPAGYQSVGQRLNEQDEKIAQIQKQIKDLQRLEGLLPHVEEQARLQAEKEQAPPPEKTKGKEKK